MHDERPSRLPGAVAWTNAHEQGAPDGLVLPDGCMDLVWLGDAVLVAGADTSARPTPTVGGTRIGLRLPPGHLPAALGIPADAVVDQLVPLAEVVSDRAGREAVRRAEARLGEGSPDVTVLEHLAADLGAGAHDTGLVDEVTRLVADGMRVRDVADRTGLGVRQLHRRSIRAFGYGPKVLGRVLRLQRALALGRRGVPAAATAARAGYADQQHLARELRDLTGRTWGTLVGPAQPSGA